MCVRLCVYRKTFSPFFIIPRFEKQTHSLPNVKPPLCVCCQSFVNLQLNGCKVLKGMNGDNLRDSNQSEAQEPNTQQNSRKTIIWEYILGLLCLPGIPRKRNITHLSKSFTYRYWRILQCWHPRTCFFVWYRLEAAILVFAFASAISVEQPMLVCSVVSELLSVRWCQSTGGSFMKWWQMHAGHHHNGSSLPNVSPQSRQRNCLEDWPFQGQM